MHFVLIILFVLTLAAENDTFSILVLSTKKRYSSFSKKVFVFQKICFKIKVLNVQNFHWCSHKNMPISQTEGYFENPRSSHRRCSIREACNVIKKETLALVFSCEFWEISKSTFLTEYLWMTASEMPGTGFRRIYAFFVGFKMKPLRKSVLQC